MKTTSHNLLTDLILRTNKHIDQVEDFRNLSIEELNWKSSPESWSILECIEHLHRYGEYYLPEIERRISQSKTAPDADFKSGLLGNYFAEMMLPRENFKKMKTLKDKDPIGSKLNKTTLDTFLQQQEKTLELLKRSRSVSLNKTKTSVSIAKFIKLKLGDTFRVIIYHNERHIAQAERVQKAFRRQDSELQVKSQEL